MENTCGIKQEPGSLAHTLQRLRGTHSLSVVISDLPLNFSPVALHLHRCLNVFSSRYCIPGSGMLIGWDTAISSVLVNVQTG